MGGSRCGSRSVFEGKEAGGVGEREMGLFKGKRDFFQGV